MITMGFTATSPPPAAAAKGFSPNEAILSTRPSNCIPLFAVTTAAAAGPENNHTLEMTARTRSK